ncbi:MAG: membrane protein insertase YidC [Vicinamibacterales bacterium]
MEKRVLLAVGLSALVLVIYQTLFVKPVPRPAPPSAVAGASATPSPAGAGTAAIPEATPRVDSPPVATVRADSAERELVVNSPAVRAVFTNRGGILTSWQLKNYVADNGQPIDMVPPGLPESDPRAFALVAEDPEITRRLDSALFVPSVTELDTASGNRRLLLEFEDAAGLKATKEWEFFPDGHNYLVTFSARVEVRGAMIPVAVSSGPGVGDTARAVGSSSFLSPSYYQKPEGLVQRGRDVTRLAAAQLAEAQVHEGIFTGVGADDQYFIALVLPEGRNTRVTYDILPATATAAGPRDLVRFRARVAGGFQNVKMFLGPKQYGELAAVDRELVRTINFGMFDWLVVPLLQALNWIDAYVTNYGWSIILLTLLLSAAISPLRHRSVVSMRKMQQIQPQVKAIQERYAHLKATDPARQKMNTEMMNLYREQGVNPASGCLPLVLTMPVLFAFYAMLSQAIELRGAPFMGWIHDLSTHDPYYVTPLLMGASMVLQQRMQPTSADPVQQKVMMFMPVMFTFMFLWAPSGLVLYWLVSNLWAIGQQQVTNMLIGPPPAPAPRPGGSSRIKQAGSGRSAGAQ